MADWYELLIELIESGSGHDIIRRKYIRQLHELTKRNIIVYYSGWLQKPSIQPYLVSINDSDKLGLMTVIHNLDPSKGLDLLLHTPGGDMAASWDDEEEAIEKRFSIGRNRSV